MLKIYLYLEHINKFDSLINIIHYKFLHYNSQSNHYIDNFYNKLFF